MADCSGIHIHSVTHEVVLLAAYGWPVCDASSELPRDRRPCHPPRWPGQAAVVFLPMNLDLGLL